MLSIIKYYKLPSPISVATGYSASPNPLNTSLPVSAVLSASAHSAPATVPDASFSSTMTAPLPNHRPSFPSTFQGKIHRILIFIQLAMKTNLTAINIEK